MDEFFTASCGCRFKRFNDHKVGKSPVPSIEIDYYNINYACPLLWQLLQDGLTIGVFQLEQSLGRDWSKRMYPESLEDVSALTAVIRPGTLKSKMEDGKSAAKHFVDRKNNIEEYESIDPTIEDITSDTYGIIMYQETAMQIASKVAGFDLQQADSLRKAMGKKDAQLMAKTRIEFIDGCRNTGLISDERANFIFDIIEKANRYSFNKSHAFCYGETALWCVVAKAHFSKEFFCAYLRNADNKAHKKEEVATLVYDAKQFNIEVDTPSILNLHKNFELDELSIRCGIGNIASVGEKNVDKLIESVKQLEKKLNKPIKDWTWFEILLHLAPETNKTVIQNLISVGGFSHLNQYRRYLLFEFLKFKELDDKDIEFMKSRKRQDFKSGLRDLIDSMVDVYSKANNLSYAIGAVKFTAKHRAKLMDILNILEHPNSELKDTEEWISNSEEKLIGVPITCMKLDACDKSFGNCLCVEFAKSDMKEFRIAAQLTKVSQYVPKQGKLEGLTMAYIVLSDSSGSCQAVAFPDAFREFEYLLFDGNTVGIIGKKSSSGGLQINRVVQL